MRNVSVSILAWVIAAVLAAVLWSYAFNTEFTRVLAIIVAARLTINLLLLGLKEVIEGKNGGSRVI